MSETAAFTVTLPPQEAATSVADPTSLTSRRVIFLKSASSIVQEKSNKILLEKIYDSDPSGENIFGEWMILIMILHNSSPCLSMLLRFLVHLRYCHW